MSPWSRLKGFLGFSGGFKLQVMAFRVSASGCLDFGVLDFTGVVVVIHPNPKL